MSRLAQRLNKFIVPRFLRPGPQAHPREGFFNYRWMWLAAMGLLAAVSLVPLVTLTAIDYRLTRRAAESELVLRSVRSASNVRRTLTYFLDERRAVLEYTLREESYESLTAPGRLDQVFKDLRIGFGGFIDLGLIKADGRQETYVGPFDLTGRDYAGQPWFEAALEDGSFVSDVFLGLRDVPHVVIAVRGEKKSGGLFLLRATLDIKHFMEMLASLEIGENGDAFLINSQGVLQTASDFYGPVLGTAGIEPPPFAAHTSHFLASDTQGRKVLVAYAYIKGSPFILCVVKRPGESMEPWLRPRWNLLRLLAASLLAILGAIYAISTYMTNAIHEANARQAQTMESMEQAGRLASIGRLAAGVAHEINNPLAVISERAGLVRDMLTMPGVEADERLIRNIDIVAESVERCGQITKQLLSFARKVDLDVAPLDVGKVIRDVLRFLEKEAHYRGIAIRLEVPGDLPQVRSDRGKLQQILLNLVTNAFQAMEDGGSLTLAASANSGGGVTVKVKDTGCGIQPDNMKRIFEPFFTTKAKSGGSGLGLSITYGLVKKLNGSLAVDSEPGHGTTFTITLPLVMEVDHGTNENFAG